MAFRTAPVVAASLVGGYLVARETKREYGGAILAGGALVAGSQWAKRGRATTTALTALYLGSFGASHPLAKKIGAWPAVLSAAGASAAGAWALADRRR